MLSHCNDHKHVDHDKHIHHNEHFDLNKHIHHNEHVDHNKRVDQAKVSAKSAPASAPASSRVPATPKEQARTFEVDVVEHWENLGVKLEWVFDVGSKLTLMRFSERHGRAVLDCLLSSACFFPVLISCCFVPDTRHLFFFQVNFCPVLTL